MANTAAGKDVDTTSPPRKKQIRESVFECTCVPELALHAWVTSANERIVQLNGFYNTRKDKFVEVDQRFGNRGIPDLELAPIQTKLRVVVRNKDVEFSLVVSAGGTRILTPAAKDALCQINQCIHVSCIKRNGVFVVDCAQMERLCDIIESVNVLDAEPIFSDIFSDNTVLCTIYGTMRNGAVYIDNDERHANFATAGAFFCEPHRYLLRCIMPLALNQTTIKIRAASVDAIKLFGFVKTPTMKVEPDGSLITSSPATLERLETDKLNIATHSQYAELLLTYWPPPTAEQDYMLRRFLDQPTDIVAQVGRPATAHNWQRVYAEIFTYSRVFYIADALAPLAGVSVKCDEESGQIMLLKERHFGGAEIPHVLVIGIHSMTAGKGSDRFFSRLASYVASNVPEAIIIKPFAPLEVMRWFMLRRGGCMYNVSASYSCLVVDRSRLFSPEAAREIELMLLNA